MKTIAAFVEEEKWRYLIVFVISISLFIGIGTIFMGNFPFWYDPARDFMMAWNNLSHPTLIGPTSGIPGIFYGPYWIWLLSIGIFISKDPRVAMILILAIPYLLVLPVLFMKNLVMYKKMALTAVWTLFVGTYGLEYATKPWNPYLAPLLLFILIPLLASIDLSRLSRKTSQLTVLTGAICGLIANAHLSLGSGVLIGSCVFLVMSAILSGSFSFKHSINRVKIIIVSVVLFGVGVGISFVPYLLFELRHGFNQTKMLIFMITSPFPVVGVQGLSEGDILRQFPLVATRLIHVPEDRVKIIFVVVTGIFLMLIAEKRVALSRFDKKILGAVALIFIALFGIYMTSKNPVWEYHFIGMEVLVLFYILVLVEKVFIFRIAVLILGLYLLLGHLGSFIAQVKTEDRFRDAMSTKAEVTDLIVKDAKGIDYVVYPHSSSIYTYDYAYLFRWKNGVEVPYDPSQNIKVANTAYLIIPSVGEAVRQDFISSKTRNNGYVLTQKWVIRDVEVQKIEKK